MSTHDSLFLHEEVMLLALHDEKGTISAQNYLFAIGGAVLAELLLSERVRVSEERKKKFIEVRSSRPLGDPIVDQCLAKVCEAKRRATVETWVSRFSAVKNLKHQVAQQLCKRGILRADEDKVMWIFTRKIYPEINPVPERNLIKKLERAIFSEKRDVDPHTIVLVSLANGADLLRYSFDRKELKARKQRIEQLVNGELAGKATKEAIEAMQAAVFVAVIMPAMMTTVIHN